MTLISHILKMQFHSVIPSLRIPICNPLAYMVKTYNDAILMKKPSFGYVHIIFVFVCLHANTQIMLEIISPNKESTIEY